MSRDYLYIGSTVLFIVAVAIFAPSLYAAKSVGAALSPWIGFWIVYIISVMILAIVWAVISILRGTRPNLLGLKDERDKGIEAKAVMAAFFVLFGLSFPGLVLLSSGHSLLAFKILAGSGILAVGVLTIVATWDAVQTLRLSLRQS